jgi:5-methylcytosine-specific restriction protein A
MVIQDDGKYIRTRGRKWMRLREQVLTEEPVCYICKRRPSTQVDHKKPVSKGGTDERENLGGVCDECHEDKTMKDLGMTKKKHRVGLDGYPMKEKHAK